MLLGVSNFGFDNMTFSLTPDDPDTLCPTSDDLLEAFLSPPAGCFFATLPNSRPNPALDFDCDAFSVDFFTSALLV